jgi:putative hemolysin
VRLLLPNSMARGRLGLDLESKVDLRMLSGSAISTAEVTRYCVLRRYRCTRVTHALFSLLREESARRGITHWVAGANMETDFAEDAALAYRVAGDQSLFSPRFRAEAHASRPPSTRRTRHCYTAEQRRHARAGERSGLDLPRTLSLFARRMGARFIGPPVYDAYFNVFALPLVTALADLAVP